MTVFEQVSSIKNVYTGATVTCQSTELSAPYQFRNSILKTVGGAGGINTHTGGRAPIAPRTVKLGLLHVYNQLLPLATRTPALVETYSSVMAAFDAVLGSGYEVQLTLTDANGNLWYNTAVVESVEKAETPDANVSMVKLPVTFTFFMPYWSAQYKAGGAVRQRAVVRQWHALLRRRPRQVRDHHDRDTTRRGEHGSRGRHDPRLHRRHNAHGTAHGTDPDHQPERARLQRVAGLHAVQREHRGGRNGDVRWREPRMRLLAHGRGGVREPRHPLQQRAR